MKSKMQEDGVGARQRNVFERFSPVAGAVGLLCLAVVGIPSALSPESQWDFDTYYYASKVYEQGGNPLDHRELADAAGRSVFPFVYPHHTLLFFRLFTFGDLASGKQLYLTAKLACVAALLVLWTRSFVKAGGRGWFLAFAAFGYHAALSRDLTAGNVSVFEQTLIWFGLFALMRGRLWLFCLLIILSAQFKIIPICLLGLVVLTDARYKWHFLAGSVVVWVASAAGVYLSDPQTARSFFELASFIGQAELGGAYNQAALPMIREIVAAAMERLGPVDVFAARNVARWIYGFYIIAVLATVAGSLRRQRDLRLSLFIALLTYALVVPRMKDYSYVLLLVPTFELIRQGLDRLGARRWPVLALVGLLVMPCLDVLWRFRSLLMAGWTWAIALKAEPAGRR